MPSVRWATASIGEKKKEKKKQEQNRGFYWNPVSMSALCTLSLSLSLSLSHGVSSFVCSFSRSSSQDWDEAAGAADGGRRSPPSLIFGNGGSGGGRPSLSSSFGPSEKERHLMRDIRSWQMRAAGVERKLQQTKVAYALALQKRALAQADVEEAVDSSAPSATSCCSS